MIFQFILKFPSLFKILLQLALYCISMHGLQSRSNALVIDHIYYLEEIELFQFLIVIDDVDEEFI